MDAQNTQSSMRADGRNVPGGHAIDPAGKMLPQIEAAIEQMVSFSYAYAELHVAWRQTARAAN